MARALALKEYFGMEPSFSVENPKEAIAVVVRNNPTVVEVPLRGDVCRDKGPPDQKEWNLALSTWVYWDRPRWVLRDDCRN